MTCTYNGVPAVPVPTVTGGATGKGATVVGNATGAGGDVGSATGAGWEVGAKGAGVGDGTGELPSSPKS